MPHILGHTAHSSISYDWLANKPVIIHWHVHAAAIRFLILLLLSKLGFWSITLAYNIDILIENTPLRSIGVATVIAPVVCIRPCWDS